MLDRDTFSRRDKILIEKLNICPAEATSILSKSQIMLCWGKEVVGSAVWQSAILTAANTAVRCFPGMVVCDGANPGQDMPLAVPFGSAVNFADALKRIGVRKPPRAEHTSRIVFGSRRDVCNGLHVTFDGWAAAVGPGEEVRLLEREHNPLAGVAAGALAVSELFLRIARVNIEATKRTIGMSLWRPELSWDALDAVGMPLEVVPNEAWLLGLGHLGQAYLWCIGLLPYSDPSDMNLLLNDYDTLVTGNWDSGSISRKRDRGKLKSRVALRWLRARGFSPKLLERPFQKGCQVVGSDPGLGLCGFDGKGPREALDQVGFQFVTEAGLGGRSDNFDAISIHSFPNGQKAATKFWPSSASPSMDESAILENVFYRSVAAHDGCGHMQLASVSAAVPFVGAVAATIVLAEPLRILHGGKRYDSVDVRLESPTEISAVPSTDESLINISYQSVQSFWPRQKVDSSAFIKN
ncbi:MAG TPA: hypothetical protein VMJ32_14500 [Pirellulales bacterium]|nr:hypothetical protein [Pirellulales bacterium]